MTTPPPSQSASAVPHPTEPVYAESELYDSPADLLRWPLLAPLLTTWQTEVWEKDHTEFRGCWRYDQEAIGLQKRHRWAVVLAAMAGTCAVAFAILQLGMEHRVGRPLLESVLRMLVGRTAATAAEAATNFLMALETLCLGVVICIVVFSWMQSLDHRWRELRFKAEHYRMLKFRFLHDAAVWLQASEEEQGLHLFKHLALIHSANRASIKKWIHWKMEMLPMLQTPDIKPDAALAAELAGYFRERRFGPQRAYFKNRGHQLHRVEKWLRRIGPGLFWGSVAFALIHVGVHIAHQFLEPSVEPTEELAAAETMPPAFQSTMAAAERTLATAERTLDIAEKSLELQTTSSGKLPGKGMTKINKYGTAELHAGAAQVVGLELDRAAGRHVDEHETSTLVMLAFALAMFAAILPVAAAGVRTWRGAFEFGRNSLRFEAMSHHLEHLLDELPKAKSPEAILALLRRGEYAMENEHRAWMRLMMEAEWIG